mmetsp:Transcript_936/g.1988  ORF Transcript_936/g.1988 Transcript_936/m.1988 type:complete len:277 (+) Transcript_936:960-1790(+)
MNAGDACQDGRFGFAQDRTASLRGGVGACIVTRRRDRRFGFLSGGRNLVLSKKVHGLEEELHRRFQITSLRVNHTDHLQRRSDVTQRFDVRICFPVYRVPEFVQAFINLQRLQILSQGGIEFPDSVLDITDARNHGSDITIHVRILELILAGVGATAVVVGGGIVIGILCYCRFHRHLRFVSLLSFFVPPNIDRHGFFKLSLGQIVLATLRQNHTDIFSSSGNEYVVFPKSLTVDILGSLVSFQFLVPVSEPIVDASCAYQNRCDVGGNLLSPFEL